MPPTPPPTPEWPLPKFNLRVDDLAHPGVALFFDSVDAHAALRDAVLASFKWLYATPEHAPTNVRSILLVLRAMEGVAYTSGSREEKEIHFSLAHIVNSAARARDEILGVLTHEVVHCYQHNANGTAPGGLIEGIADFVRLRAGLAPPRWRRVAKRHDRWDAGYEKTGYFLEWVEALAGAGTVRKLNAALDGVNWEEGVFERLAGKPVRELWCAYKAELHGGEEGDSGDNEDDGFTLV
ncbi:hypothetical protein GGX14DRAFT_465181 [Mycena pura]|uniref:Plant basic secretory protein n=1 Tax=Mycena pura TaxID=153505 RepID=A0AAD6V2K2_9AGAR|nr:hypothetical protein GGX14DRAFT_465181 [Mycena pura]